MVRTLYTALACVLLSFSVTAQNVQAYELYNSKGKKLSFKKMIKSMTDSEVILLGELHNDPVSHWMHLEVVKALFERDSSITLGAEMFERDQQLLLTEYVSGVIRDKDFKNQARLWPNYETDYKPFVKFAADNELPFIATNVPRRYAAGVAQKGTEFFDELSDEAKNYLPPLPFPFDDEAPEYAEMLEMMGGHGGENTVKAQALKDATMAYFIIQNLREDGFFIHIHGDYHSKNYGSIYTYLNEYGRDDLSIATFSTVVSANGEWQDDFKGRADFILVVTDSMIKTH